MGKDQIGIADMQCWIFRHAQRDWNLSPAQCADLFKQYDILGYIAECYDILHVSSYQSALDEARDILASKGVSI